MKMMCMSSMMASGPRTGVAYGSRGDVRWPDRSKGEMLDSLDGDDVYGEEELMHDSYDGGGFDYGPWVQIKYTMLIFPPASWWRIYQLPGHRAYLTWSKPNAPIVPIKLNLHSLS